jgi:hypothetical protein
MRATKDEKIRRIRVIQEYLLEGQNAVDIIQTICTNYDIGVRSAQKYIEAARKVFIEINNANAQESFAEHLAARRRIIKKWEKIDPKIALESWKDLAKLDGSYNYKQQSQDANSSAEKEKCEFIMPGGQVFKI